MLGPDGKPLLQHDGLFDDAVSPCFQEMADKGLMSPLAASIAKIVVPKLASQLRDYVFDHYCADSPKALQGGSNASPQDSMVAAAAAKISITKDDLFVPILATAGDLRVTCGDAYFTQVGETYKLSVTRQNPGNCSPHLGERQHV